MPGRSRKRGRHQAPDEAAARPSAPRARPADPADPPARQAVSESPPEPTGTPGGGRPLPSHLPPPRESRSEARNAEIRATLRPYAPGERPRVVLVSVALAAALALANLGCWIGGVQVDGKHVAASGVIIFAAVLLACAAGMWQMRAGAVLGFMCLMAIIAILFTLFLIEASNVLGVVVAIAIIGVSGYLFFKLVRVLSRIQMPPESP